MKSCPKCDVTLEAITVVDLGNKKAYSGFTYTRGEPKASSWRVDRIKNAAGKVNAWLCPTCDRVLWYAEAAGEQA